MTKRPRGRPGRAHRRGGRARRGLPRGPRAPRRRRPGARRSRTRAASCPPRTRRRPSPPRARRWPLRVHREACAALDLVAPELDAQRVAERRVHVDEAATYGELAARADLLDALVAERGEPGDQSSKARLDARAQLAAARLEVERQKALQQGHGVRHARRRRVPSAASACWRSPTTCAAGATSAPYSTPRAGSTGDLAVQIHRQVRGKARRGVAVGSHDQAPRRRWRAAPRRARRARRSWARRRPRRAAAAARPSRNARRGAGSRAAQQVSSRTPKPPCAGGDGVTGGYYRMPHPDAAAGPRRRLLSGGRARPCAPARP